METRLSEVNQLANQSQIRLNETTHVINSLEDRQKITEVCNYFTFFLKEKIRFGLRYLICLFVFGGRWEGGT